MPRESRLEKYIKNFVFEKIAESVKLHLRDKIVVKHVTNKGSTTLAVFWANVLQLSANFPPLRFPYRRHRDAESRTDWLVVRAEGVTFVLNLRTGTLTMWGEQLYEWFTTKFVYVLDHYDEAFRQTWHFTPTPQLEFPPLEDASVVDPYTETEEYLLMKTTTHTQDSALERRVQEHTEELISGVGDLSIDPDLLSGDDLENDVASLTPGMLKDSFTIIYHLWKSLLNKWFSAPGTRVYLASPVLDKDRLGDVVRHFMQYRVNGVLGTYYVTHACDAASGKSLIQLQRDVCKAYTPKEQTFIEYHIFRKMLCPLQKFSCNYIAGVREGEAEVLVTSAPFHGSHFSNSCLDTVSFHRMPEDEFAAAFVQPISSPVAATQY